MRVLCVARHPILSEHLCRFFERFEVAAAPCVGIRSARGMITAYDPDIMICDYDLLTPSELEGWRADASTKTVPIVAVSMTKRPGEVRLAAATGVVGFLYLPIALLVAYSFNRSPLVTVWGGFSLRWYGALAGNAQLLDAAWVTLRVGLLSATLATGLGTLAALALARFGPFRGRLLFNGLVLAPVVMPEVISGLSMLLLFVAMLVFSYVANRKNA